jgi:hypothetical protein
LQASVENLQGEVVMLRQQMTAILEIANTAKGGWKTLLAVGGIAASIGASIAAFVHKMWNP